MISFTVLCLNIIAYGWLYPRPLFLTIVPSPASINPGIPPRLQPELRSAHLVRFKKQIGRNQSGVKSVISLLAISGSVLATVLISNREGSIAMEEIQRHVSSLASSGSETNSNVPKTRGEFGEIERFFKTRLSQVASLTERL